LPVALALLGPPAVALSGTALVQWWADDGNQHEESLPS
jgi:hypothetical protein